jgi:uncharacterized protein YjhX (UPF0386 family)
MAERLGARQLDLLDRVCRTSGGGVSCFGEQERVYRSLERKGLIQGKSGQQYRAVHTREGLALWRKMQAERENAS